MPKSTLRLVEIAEILGVGHQRASKIVAGRGFPKPIGREARAAYGIGGEVGPGGKGRRRKKPWR